MVYNDDTKYLKEDERMVVENYKYFEENFDTLYEQFGGKYIVLKNREVIAAYDDFAAAVKETAKTEELGTFSVQHCEWEEPQKIVRYFNDNINFEKLGVV